MSGRDTFAYRVRQYLMSLPGKRGIDIPEARFDQIHQAASAITQATWGQPPTPQQLQYLHEHTDGTEAQIHAHYGGLEHPQAKGISVAQYGQWKAAYHAWNEHVGKKPQGQGRGRS
jgi:hypothetical protein